MRVSETAVRIIEIVHTLTPPSTRAVSLGFCDSDQPGSLALQRAQATLRHLPATHRTQKRLREKTEMTRLVRFFRSIFRVLRPRLFPRREERAIPPTHLTLSRSPLLLPFSLSPSLSSPPHPHNGFHQGRGRGVDHGGAHHRAQVEGVGNGRSQGQSAPKSHGDNKLFFFRACSAHGVARSLFLEPRHTARARQSCSQSKSMTEPPGDRERGVVEASGIRCHVGARGRVWIRVSDRLEFGIRKSRVLMCSLCCQP